MKDKIDRLKQWIYESDNIVFFGGAGVSTESGIPDFRSPGGIFQKKYPYPPETMLSHTFFMTHTDEFYRFYKELLFLDAPPNAAHLKLSALEKSGKLKAVITQNIDGLHQKAGSKNVIELHGSVFRNYCMRCGQRHGVETIAKSAAVPHCACGGLIKPDVVLYEEPLDDNTVDQAVRCLQAADVLIIGGTSLAVYPAAGLLRYYHGTKLALINKSETSADQSAALVLHGSIGELFADI